MKQTKERSVVKGINFHIEKILSVHIGMQNVHLSGSKNGIIFDPLHDVNGNFQGLLSKKVLLLGW